MKLHLLRHAKTNQDSKTGQDFDRELLPKGEKQVAEMAPFLSKLKNIEVHCSSAKRTRQTFELLSSTKNNDSFQFDSIHFSNELYLCSHLDLLNYINSLNTKNDILLIGHNNGISDFASYLSDEFIDFKTCGYCELEIQIDSWNELSRGTAKVINRFRPEVE